MYYIQSLPLLQKSLELDGCVVHGEACYLESGKSQGSFLMPAFKPRLAESWEGLDVYPDEVGVEIQVRHPDTHQVYRYDADTNWQITNESHYQSVASVRRGLMHWLATGIQFKLRLNRLANGLSPVVSEVGVGFEVALEQLGYILDFSLPQTLSAAVELVRIVEPVIDAHWVGVPVGINPERILSPYVRFPNRGEKFQGTVQPADQNLPARIQFDQALPDEPAYLVFRYVPLVQHAAQLYQVSEIPTVLLRSLAPQNERKVVLPDWIQTSDAEVKRSVESRWLDYPVDVIVIAADFQEARTISNQLTAEINKRNFLEVAGWGKVIPMQILQGMHPGVGDAGDSLTVGDLATQHFRLLLRDIQEGQVFCRQPVLNLRGPRLSE